MRIKTALTIFIDSGNKIAKFQSNLFLNCKSPETHAANIKNTAYIRQLFLEKDKMINKLKCTYTANINSICNTNIALFLEYPNNEYT